MPKNPHTELVNSTLVKIGATPHGRFWKNNTGAGIPLAVVKMFAAKHGGFVPLRELVKYTLHYGLVGSSDIVGILKNGKMCAIECKTGGGKQNVAQINFESMIQNFGGHYFVVREETPILELIQQASEG